MPHLFTCPDAKDMRVNLCNLITAFQPLFLPSVLQTDKTAQGCLQRFKQIKKSVAVGYSLACNSFSGPPLHPGGIQELCKYCTQWMGFEPGLSGSDSKESACNGGDQGPIRGWEDPLRREQQLAIPGFLPGELCGQRSWRATGHWVTESQTTTGLLRLRIQRV